MTTTTAIENPTAQVLFEMLTENTGRHFLDSGGAYGRQWERNQGTTLEGWLASPRTMVSTHNWPSGPEVDITINVFHFLRACLDYEPALDAIFQAYADSPEMESEGWLTIMESFPPWLAENGPDEYRGNGRSISQGTINSYNNEDALSQVIQYTGFNLEGHDWFYGGFALLQVHGGCDVRGGYTRPRVFRTNDEVILMDNARLEAVEDAPLPPQDTHLPGIENERPAQFYWDSDDAGYHWYGTEGTYGDLKDVPWVWADSEDEVKSGQVTVMEDGVVFGPHGGRMRFYSRADWT